VDQPGGVRRGEPAPGGHEGLEDGAHRPLRAEPARQRRARDELHRDEELPFVLAYVVDRHHVRARQARHRLRLADQALAESLPFGRSLGAEYLDRHLAPELRVDRRIHHAHRPGPEPLDHAVSPHRWPRQRRRFAQ
jgi:hypothetical protein